MPTRPEQAYCRAPLARYFNGLENTSWIPNRNTGLGYISGLPDAFVSLCGRFIAVECKASMGSLFLGDPDNEANTSGWHYHQRQWWEKVAIKSNISYWIAVWIYPEKDPKRVNRVNHALFFLVPPEAWLAVEAKLGGRKTLGFNSDTEREHAYKNVTAESEFANYRLDYINGGWIIPDTHPFWRLDGSLTGTTSTRNEEVAGPVD